AHESASQAPQNKTQNLRNARRSARMRCVSTVAGRRNFGAAHSSVPPPSPRRCPKASRHHRRLDPALHLRLDNVQKYANAAIAFFEAGDEGEVFAAVIEKELLVLLCDLFERLEAICGKAWRDNSEPLHTIARQRLDGLVGIGLQPLHASEA